MVKESTYKQYTVRIVCPICDNVNKTSKWLDKKRKYEYSQCAHCTVYFGYYILLHKNKPVVYNVSMSINNFTE